MVKMRIILKRITGILAFVLILMSSQQVMAGGAMADSLRVKWMDGKKYVLHKVDVKETWSLLSRRYNVTVDEIKLSNNGINDLKVGQIIHIPVIQREQPIQGTPASTATVVKQPVFYTVKHGETLYSVSKRFGKTVEEMREMNRLDTDQLREGQQLVVRYIDKSVGDGQPVSSEQKSIAPASTPSTNRVAETPSGTRNTATGALPAVTAVVPAPLFEKPTKTIEPIRKASGGKTLVQVTETGVASWVPDGEVNQDKYYGLHRSAPIGTIIKVTNRMNNQSVYVKIVGVLPDTGDNENVIIKVSQAVANKLNALDALFRAELSYGLMQ
jgi:LysM repeat protein